MSNLRLRNLSKDFGALRVLHDIDLAVEPGEFVALVGPSGCGKSTLLSIIAGLDEPTKGSIEIAGREVNDWSPKDRNIAMVFQNYALYPTMTVRQNLTFGLSLRRIPRKDQAASVERVARLLHIEELLDRKPSQLSGGQRQRVAMGRALVRDPSIFLFDEPLSNLDAKLRVKMRSEIKKLHRRLGITTVYVTHDQVEAMTLSTRIAIMDGGRVQQFDTPDVVYRQPANVFVATFIGSIPMNVLPAARKGGELFLRDAEGERSLGLRAPVAEALANGSDVLLGIRAENVTVHPGGKAGDLRAMVDLVEPLGAEQLVTLRLGEETLVTSVPADMQVDVDQIVGLSLDLSRASFFDTVSKERIPTPTEDVRPALVASTG
jgi:multiple sugar transport system ATP-binding protein